MLTQKKDVNELFDLEIDDYQGDSYFISGLPTPYLLISMVKSTSCPFCMIRFVELNMEAETLKKAGVSLWVFFNDSSESLRQKFKNYSKPISENLRIFGSAQESIRTFFNFKKDYFAMFKTIQSMEQAKVVFKNIGAKSLKTLKDPSLPGDLLLSTKGEILLSHASKNFSDHIMVVDIIKKIKALGKV